MNAVDPRTFTALTEGLAATDAFTSGWLQQAVLRLRRELAWAWREQAGVDLVADALQRRSLAQRRLDFFRNDPAARHLDGLLREVGLPRRARTMRRGGFAWVTRELDLAPAAIFVFALALAAARDAATGELIAALQDDARKTGPTLALAQRLWDEPQAVASLAVASDPLFTRGLLRAGDERDDWQAPLRMPGWVAQLLEGRDEHAPGGLEAIARPSRRARGPIDAGATHEDVDLQLLAGRLRPAPAALAVVPVRVAQAGTPLDARRCAGTLARLSALTRRAVYTPSPSMAASTPALESAALLCWLRGADLLLLPPAIPGGADWRALLRPFPIRVFAALPDDATAPEANALPALVIAAPGHAERRAIWAAELARHRLPVDPDALRECAFRFRLDAATIADVVAAVARSGAAPTPQRLLAACQQQVGSPIGLQAERLVPRFRRGDLALDAEPARQFAQLLDAMRHLATVHADWGTGQAWGDAGISALFAGASGTGKTMAAEVLAAELDRPLYHVDLSQVVSKYIGETEKNLRQLFDAAERSDAILFFDEADSLFGTRTQARSANDRFANMEISYLLQRMDRFRGLAILATNRRKDLDEAFLRRLRYVIEFPLPSEAQRRAIWATCIPTHVSAQGLDLDFLAREFALAGGHIRSIVLNACLCAAGTRRGPALDMDTVMDAIDREYHKIGRPLSREQKARWGTQPGAERAVPAPGVLQ